MRAKLSTGALLFALISPLQAATLPAQGLSMQAVEQQFGAPIKKNAAIGQPPITRWEYNGYVVVFERSTVIQSVEVAASPAAAPAPKPVTAPAPRPVPVAAPAPAATPVPAPVAAPVPAPATDTAEAERQARENAAMAKARAEREAAAKAAPAPAPVEVPAAPVATPAPEAAPAAVAPVTPAPAPVEEPKKPKGDGSYTFDPATGRIIIN